MVFDRLVVAAFTADFDLQKKLWILMQLFCNAYETVYVSTALLKITDCL